VKAGTTGTPYTSKNSCSFVYKWLLPGDLFSAIRNVSLLLSLTVLLHSTRKHPDFGDTFRGMRVLDIVIVIANTGELYRINQFYTAYANFRMSPGVATTVETVFAAVRAGKLNT
jgi:hypothetical protein